MPKKEASIQLLLEQRLLPLYYSDSEEISINVLDALYKGGVRMVEYTARGENALNNFAAMVEAAEKSMPGMQLGIGTIKTEKQATDYISAGAHFIVCPTINEKVAMVTHAAGLLWIPGCMTPTEIAAAEAAGATIVKIFPGNILGPAYINAIKELFPGLKFMPTGGVEAEMNNLQEWFNSGVVAVGMGSKLISKKLMEAKNYDTLKVETVRALALVQQTEIK